MTYAGAHGRRDEVDPDNWILHREWVLARDVHSLSARRAETTKIALEDLEAPAHHLRLALGVAAGAILVAGSFVASALNGTSEDTSNAASVPEHTVAALEQRLSVTQPPAEAPAPAPAPVNEQPQQETAPPATEPQVDAVAAPVHAAGGGENQRTTPSADTPAPVPAPAQNQHWGSDSYGGSGGHWGSVPQQGYYGGQWGSGSQWGDNQWGDNQWGYGQSGYGTQPYPVSGFGTPTPSSYSAATSTPAGPAMTMLDPFCNTPGR